MARRERGRRRNAVRAVNSAQGSERRVDAPVLIAGGGITGLGAANALVHSHGIETVLAEGGPSVGGAISTRSNDAGFLWEEGPNSFQPSNALLRLAEDAGLASDVVFGDPAAPRFVLWDGIQRKVPSSIGELISTDLISTRGKLRAAAGVLGFKPSPPETHAEYESIASFVERNLGEEVLQRLVDPFISGVYAGSPHSLCMAEALQRVWQLEHDGGSLIGGALLRIAQRFGARKQEEQTQAPFSTIEKPKGQTVGSFRNGLLQLPQALHQRLGERVKLNWRLQRIDPIDNEGCHRAVFATPHGEEEVRARKVVLTAPAHAIAGALGNSGARGAKAELDGIKHPSVWTVALAYRQQDIIPHMLDEQGVLRGFGQLHPRSEGIRTLGTLFASQVFEGRAPEGYITTLNFVGGTTDEEAASLSKEEVVNVADRDTRQTLVREGSLAPEVLGTRLWSKAIPQLEAGHTELLARAQQSLEAARLSNVILGGSYVSGISLPKCADGAYALASQVADELAHNRATRKVEERQSMEQKGESEVEQGGEEGGGKAEPVPK